MREVIKKFLQESENLILLIFFPLTLDYLPGLAFLISRKSRKRGKTNYPRKRKGGCLAKMIRHNEVGTSFGIPHS